MRLAIRTIPPITYILAVVSANYLTEYYGLVPAGFGLTTTAGTYAAAAVLIARNLSQDTIGRLGVIALMIIGVALSWWLASPELAVASGVAFALSEAADMGIYTPLRRAGRGRAVAAASVAGAFVDTYVFLYLAGFPASAAPGQLIIKAGMGLAAALIIGGAGALLRQPLQPIGGGRDA